METLNKTSVTVQTTVNVSIEKAWNYFTAPEHIVKWYHASDDWHAPMAENDLVTGGSFKTRMEAKDGSFGFDFGGVYTQVIPHRLIEFTMGDDRKVRVSFAEENNQVVVTETFEAENTHPVEMQKNGWQAILDNYRQYAEKNQG